MAHAAALDPQRSLLSLPPELHYKIISNLSLKDALALAKVNPLMQNAVYGYLCGEADHASQIKKLHSALVIRDLSLSAPCPYARRVIRTTEVFSRTHPFFCVENALRKIKNLPDHVKIPECLASNKSFIHGALALTRPKNLPRYNKERAFILSQASEDLRADPELATLAGGRAHTEKEKILARVRKVTYDDLEDFGRDSTFPIKIPPQFKDDDEIMRSGAFLSGLILKQASSRLKKDRDFVKLALSTDTWTSFYSRFEKDCDLRETTVLYDDKNLMDLDESLWDEEIILCALTSKYADTDTFINMPARFFRDRDITLALVTANGGLLSKAPEAVQADREIVMASVCNSQNSLKEASAELKTDPEIVITAATNDFPTCISYDPTFGSIRADEDVLFLNRFHTRDCFLEDCYEKFHSDELSNDMRAMSMAPLQFTGDRACMMEAVRENPCSLKYASRALRNDRELVMRAIQAEGLTLCYTSFALRKDLSIVMEAVKNNGAALRYALCEARNSKELVMKAVSNKGFALKFAFEALRDDEEVVLAAIDNYPLALRYASCRLRRDPEVVLAAVSKDGESLAFALREQRASRDVVLAAVKNKGSSLKYASAALQNDREIAFEAVKNEKEALEFVSDVLKTDPGFTTELAQIHGDWINHYIARWTESYLMSNLAVLLS